MIEIFFIILLIVVYFNLYNITRSLRWINRKELKKSENVEYVFLIPLYKEERIISSTIDVFNNFSQKRKNVKIYTITTEKEGSKKENKTLKEIEKKLRKVNSKKISNIHYPYKRGGKSSQLNYAIKKLSKKSYRVFCFYDADSIPEKNIFKEIEKNYNQKYNAYQQYPIYSKGNEKLSSIDKLIHTGNVLFQTKRTFFYEIPNTLDQVKGKSIRPHYLIGHGLVINSKLFETEKFPENSYIEDLPFGYNLFYNGKKVIPLKSFDVCEAPKKYNILFKQASIWFGEEFKQNLHHFKEYVFSKKFKLRNLLVTSVKFSENIFWFLRSFVFLSFVIFFFIFFGNRIVFFSSLLVLLGVYLQFHFIYKFVTKNKYMQEQGESGVFVFYLLRFFLDSCGPFIYFYNLINSRIKGENRVYEKIRKN